MTNGASELDLDDLKASWKKRVGELGEEAGRIFHGRSGGHGILDWVTVDSYPPIFVLASYGPMPQTILQRLSELLIEIGREVGWSESPRFAVLHQSRSGASVLWRAFWGAIPETHEATYLGLKFELSLGSQQNTGIFMDMQCGHERVMALAKGCRVLNLFAYTCSFSLMALQSGALQVVNVDVSRAALATGRRNHLLNGIDPKRARFLPHNVMKSMSAFRRMAPFGLVVADPPSNQAGRFEARRDYPKLARNLTTIMAPGGHLLACLNAPYIDLEEMIAWFSPHHFHLVQRLGRPAAYGEQRPGEDLKILHFHYQSGTSPKVPN